MAKTEITRSGVTDPKNATSRPYGAVHIADFIDVWLPRPPAVGIDHLFYHNGEIEVRVMGFRLSELPRACPKCDETRRYVDEPLLSGFRGHICQNEECPRGR